MSGIYSNFLKLFKVLFRSTGVEGMFGQHQHYLFAMNLILICCAYNKDYEQQFSYSNWIADLLAP